MLKDVGQCMPSMQTLVLHYITLTIRASRPDRQSGVRQKKSNTAIYSEAKNFSPNLASSFHPAERRSLYTLCSPASMWSVESRKC